MLRFKEYDIIEEAAAAGLAAKASKSGVAIGILRKVYNRGMAAWKSGHRPGTTPQQWGMARVNSYITKGKGTYHGADKDLREEATDHHAQAEMHLSKANDADAKGDKKSFHAHMADHHDSMSEWHDSKGRSASADKHAEKADYHHEKSLSEEAVVPKDKETGLPKKYVAGVSDSTAKARAAHFEKNKKKSDSDPSAYKPAPGDATAKTKESKYTKKYRELFGEGMDEELYEACWDTHKQVGMKKKGDRMVPDCVPKNEAATPYYNKPSFLKKMSRVAKQELQAIAKKEAEAKKPVKEETMDEAAIDAKGHKSSTGGLTQKGRDAYNAKGANLQAPVTTPPSKLKPGSKAANRRKSFCARMGGVDGPMKKPNGEPTRKALALRKWNC
jgi:hypothetical protein